MRLPIGAPEVRRARIPALLLNVLFGFGILLSVLAAEGGPMGFFAGLSAAGSLASFQAGMGTKGLTAGITGTSQAGSFGSELLLDQAWTLISIASRIKARSNYQSQPFKPQVINGPGPWPPLDRDSWPLWITLFPAQSASWRFEITGRIRCFFQLDHSSPDRREDDSGKE